MLRHPVFHWVSVTAKQQLETLLLLLCVRVYTREKTSVFNVYLHGTSVIYFFLFEKSV